MYEMNVLISVFVIATLYFGTFYVSEKVFMKGDK